ncbi:M6 family metalloprotease domain-containing protein [Parashewanella spongiae]|uniref:M6 family metalloprotease domain-containing protein n=2 Tax=Parashewanella spongiae TaxID=342950 RepID=A0A3A6UG44_9GAMM|nr:M6 family metalloprotease domain-containing protein [Parashewanella spongiae]
MFSVILILPIGSGFVLAQPVSHTPADIGVVNEERIIYWMKKNGHLSENATSEETKQALARYTSKAQPYFPHQITKEAANAERRRLNRLTENKHLHKAPADSSDSVKTVKVLAVLIDFPDLPHNNNRLSSRDTRMYYSSYPKSHYQNMLFSTTGYSGPQSQTLRSVHQYYDDVSGNSFKFTGDAKGWFRAEQNAQYYGRNDSSRNNADNAATELVKEAVSDAVATMSQDELNSFDIEDPRDLDNDGNINESDGIIDHIMVFHSSIGEEAGGGVLGSNAIWSHSFAVNASSGGYTLPGTNKKVLGYTIQPIDAAIGVCAHEFGHDLGLPDEYDTQSGGDGSPVGLWSIMSAGTWVGTIPGSQPVGFSPYARSYLQNKFNGRWVNEQDISLSSITNTPTDYVLASAIDKQNINQLAITLDSPPIPFKQAYSGEYQYYSGQGDQLEHSMSFARQLPVSSSIILTMKSHWEMENRFDYAQVLINGVAIAGNHTNETNSTTNDRHTITGKSKSIVGAEGENGWVDLEYNLTPYSGQNVTIKMVYKTDTAVTKYGIVVDDIKIHNAGSQIYHDDSETQGRVTQAGFTRINNSRPGKNMRYLIQLRNHQGVDDGLGGSGYDPGVVIWLENSNQFDNRVSSHPGQSLIGVIDADQVLISNRNSRTQMRDAAFSLYDQTPYSGDNHLIANAHFSDSDDYTAPEKPQQGMILPNMGLSVSVVEQAQDSSSARVRINRTFEPNDDPENALVSISSTINGSTVNFTAAISGGSGGYSYLWNFGDGNTSTEVSPQHTYTQSGNYTVILQLTSSSGAVSSVTKRVTIGELNHQQKDGDTNQSKNSGGNWSWVMTLMLSGFAICRRRNKIWWSLLGSNQ